MLSIQEFFYGNVEPLWVVGTAASPIPYRNLMLNLGQYNPNRPTGSGSPHVQQNYGPSLGQRNSQLLQPMEIQSCPYHESGQHEQTSEPPRTPDHSDGHELQDTHSQHGDNQPTQNMYSFYDSDGQNLQNRGSGEQPTNTCASNAYQQKDLTSGSHRDIDRQMQYLGSNDHRSAAADQKPRSLNIYNKENRKSGKSKIQVHHASDQHNGNSSLHQKAPQLQRDRSNAQSFEHTHDGHFFDDHQLQADENGRFELQGQQSRRHGSQHGHNTGHMYGDGSNSRSHNNHGQNNHVHQTSYEYDEYKSLHGQGSHDQNQHNLQESSSYSAADSAGFDHKRDWGRSSGSLQTGYQNSNLDQAGGNFYRESSVNNGPMAKQEYAYGYRSESNDDNQKSNQYYQSANGPEGSSYESDDREEYQYHDQRNDGPQKSYPKPWPQSHEFRRQGNYNKLRYVRLWVDMCCESCEERVSGTLSNLNGTKSVECDFPSKKVVVYGTAAPADILKACRNLHKNSCMWLDEFHGSVYRP